MDQLLEAIDDGTINCETRRREVIAFKERIKHDGVYWWKDLLNALNQLIRFRKKYPNCRALTDHVYHNENEDPEDDEVLCDWPQLKELAPWIAELYDACRELQDDDNRDEVTDDQAFKTEDPRKNEQGDLIEGNAK